MVSDEDPSVQAVAGTVRAIAREEADLDPTVTLVENAPSGETTVERFDVDTSRTMSELGWTPTHSIEETIRSLVESSIDG